MKNIITIIIVLLLTSPVYCIGQNQLSLTGIVKDNENRAIPYCTVSVLSERDSSLITGSVSDDNGFYQIGLQSSGNYILRYSHLQYQTLCSNISVASSITMEDVIMEPSVIGLDEVVVKGNLIKNTPKGFVVDISNNPFAKNKSATEAMALLPGVTTYNDDLKINGIGVAKMYIDGKEVTDKAELLSIRSDMIDKIEVINNGGNRYGSISGGIVRIKLKKMPEGTYKITLGGFAVASLQQGPKYDYIYLSTRYRYKNLSINNSLQYMYNDQRSKETYQKKFLSTDNSILTKSNEHPGMQYVYDKLSLAYDINKRHNIGVSFSAMVNRADYTNKSNTILRTNGVDVVSNYLATGANDADRYQSSLIYNWDIDDDGSNFSFVADYIKNNTFMDNLNVTTYESKADSVVRQRYDIDTPWDLFKSKADLSLKLSSNSSLDAGGDFYYKNTLQKTNYENEKDNDWVRDDNLSDMFGYKGLGFGLYAGYTLSLDKFSFSPNLRLQYDFIETHPYKQGVNKRDFWHLFPELSASYSLSDVININASFGAGMNDIRYTYMNPRVVYDSEYSYNKGNPDLDPATWRMSNVNIMLFNKWTVGYRYGKVINMENTFTFADESDPNVTYIMPINMGKRKRHNLFLGYSSPILAWWHANAMIYGSWSKSIYDVYSHSSFCFNYSLYNSFNLGDNFSASLSFNGETKSKIGEEIWHPVFYTAAGVNKSFFKEKLNVSLNINNFIVKKRKAETVKDDNSFRTTRWFRYDAPFITLNFVYTFSGGKKQNIRGVKTIQETQSSEIKQK